MKSLLVLVLFCCGVVFLHAQSATPAQPVSPDQARPATPVAPDELTPNANPTTSGASMSAVTPAPSTNAPPAAAPAPANLSVIAESSLKAVLAELTQAWADNQDNNPQVPLAFTSSGIIAAKAATTGDYDVVIS